MKIMLITFFDIKGIVHFEFIIQGQTVNQAYYVAILKRLREAVLRKRLELCSIYRILHHDNAPAHEALFVMQFVAQKSMTGMAHPSLSPDLAPNDFWLFTKIKSALKGLRFQDIEVFEENMTTLKAVP
jgi:hypothetical protein